MRDILDFDMVDDLREQVSRLMAERDAARAEADGLAGLLAKALPELLNHGGDWDLRLRIRNVLAARAQPPHVSEASERNDE